MRLLKRSTLAMLIALFASQGFAMNFEAEKIIGGTPANPTLTFVYHSSHLAELSDIELNEVSIGRQRSFDIHIRIADGRWWSRFSNGNRLRGWHMCATIFVKYRDKSTFKHTHKVGIKPKFTRIQRKHRVSYLPLPLASAERMSLKLYRCSQKDFIERLAQQIAPVLLPPSGIMYPL